MLAQAASRARTRAAACATLALPAAPVLLPAHRIRGAPPSCLPAAAGRGSKRKSAKLQLSKGSQLVNFRALHPASHGQKLQAAPSIALTGRVRQRDGRRLSCWIVSGAAASLSKPGEHPNKQAQHCGRAVEGAATSSQQSINGEGRVDAGGRTTESLGGCLPAGVSLWHRPPARRLRQTLGG